VGAGLLAIAVDQHQMNWLIHRYREQARSHRGSSSSERFLYGTPLAVHPL